MSDFASALIKLREAQADLARLEAQAHGDPDSRAALLSIASKKRHLEQMRLEFAELAAFNQFEVCDYRILSLKSDSYFIRPVAETLATFQLVFSQLYDAQINGPKRRTRLNPQAEQESMLEVGYTYPGSLGFIFLVSSERDFFEGKFDHTVEAFYQLLDVKDEFEVRDIAKELGPAVVKRFHDWSISNFNARFSLDVSWHASKASKHGRHVSFEEFGRISDVIEYTSDEEEDIISIEGFLIGGDLKSMTFHIVDSEGESLKGHISDDKEGIFEMRLGDFYKAVIRRFTKLNYATNVETERYVLERLFPSKSLKR